MFFLNFGTDWGILDNDVWTPYLGFDIMAGGTDEEYSDKNGIVNTDYSGGEVLVGLRFRAGFEYIIHKRYGVFIELSRGMYILTNKITLAHNDFGFGLRYKIKE